MMERWEPANLLVSARRAGEHRNLESTADHRDELANLVFSCSGRVALALLFACLGFFRLPAAGPVIFAVFIVAGGFAGCIAGRSGGALGWSRVWIVDLVSLGLLTPWLVFTGFVGAERDPLGSGSNSAYFGCLLASLFFLVVVAVVAAWSERGRPGIAGALVLPGALEVLTLTGTLGNYRDAAVFQSLAIAYGISAVVIVLAIQAPPALRVWVAPAGWLACLVGVFFLTSGFDVLSDSGNRVVVGQLLLIAVSAVTAIKAPPLTAWLPATRAKRARLTGEASRTVSRSRRQPRRYRPSPPAASSGWFYANAEQSSTEELPSLNP